MCRAIYGTGLIVIRMREGYGDIMDETFPVGKKQQPAGSRESRVEVGWLSGLGLVLVERWSWVRISLDLWIFFSSTFENFKLFWWTSFPVLKVLNFRHSLILLYDHLYSYLRSIANIITINLIALRV